MRKAIPEIEREMRANAVRAARIRAEGRPLFSKAGHGNGEVKESSRPGVRWEAYTGQTATKEAGRAEP